METPWTRAVLQTNVAYEENGDGQSNAAGTLKDHSVYARKTFVQQIYRFRFAGLL